MSDLSHARKAQAIGLLLFAGVVGFANQQTARAGSSGGAPARRDQLQFLLGYWAGGHKGDVIDAGINRQAFAALLKRQRLAVHYARKRTNVFERVEACHGSPLGRPCDSTVASHSFRMYTRAHGG